MSSTTATTAPTTATTDLSTWKIDPSHSAAEFKVRHMMISYVKGKFSGLSGVLKLDENDYTHSTVEVSIPAASVSTVDDKLDAHLKEADFFDVEKFPTLTFKSTKHPVPWRSRLRSYRRSDDTRRDQIRDSERERFESAFQRPLGESAHRPFRLRKDQSQGIWAGVECASGIRRSPGRGRSDDHTRCAVHQGIGSCADSIKIRAAVGRLQ